MPYDFKAIVRKAKQIRKEKPKMKWQSAVSEASKQLKKNHGKRLHQTGTSKKKIDAKRNAKLPGKRKSREGNIYYEYRKNRSDMPNSLTGINEKKLIGAIKEKVEGTMGKAYIDLNNAKTAKVKKEKLKIIRECKIKLRKLK